MHAVKVIKYIEKSVAFKKGKGIKSKSILTVIETESSDVSDDDVTENCGSSAVSPPHLILFMNTDKCLKGYVVGDGVLYNKQGWTRDCTKYDIVACFILLF